MNLGDSKCLHCSWLWKGLKVEVGEIERERDGRRGREGREGDRRGGGSVKERDGGER